MIIRKLFVFVLMSTLMTILLVGQAFSFVIPNATHGDQIRNSSPAFNTVIFTDGSFMTGWDDVSGVTDDPKVPGPGPGTSSFDGSSVQTSGGNPGSYRKTTHTIVYGDRIYSGGLNTSAVYDPGTSGAIYEIDFSSDLIFDGNGSSGWHLILEQDGIRYFAVRKQDFSEADWVSFKVIALTEGEFDTAAPLLDPNDEHPDFSENGEPITFGYVVTNSRSGPGSGTSSSSIDNWSVTVNPNRSYLPFIIRD
jgi:hypothetical protein